MSDQPDNSGRNLEEENQRLTALVELGRVLADAGRPLDEKLQQGVEVLARLAGAERSSLMLVEGDELVVRAANRAEVVGMRTALSQSAISTEVARTGRPVFVKDVGQSDFAQVRRQGDQSSYRTASLISLPLTETGHTVGVLNLSDKAGAPHFDDADLALAQDIASQVSRLVHFSAMHSRLEDAYQQLSRAQKAKDDLMYMIFHDMKAPVTGVKEVLGLLGQEGGLEPEEQGQYLALAQADLEQLWRRITNLLDLNRMDAEQLPMNPQPLDMAALAAEAVARLEAVSRIKEVAMVVEAPEAGAEALVDEDLAERILVNLLFNALKFSSPEEGGGGRVEVIVSAGEQGVLVEVADTGPGVDPELGDAVFERFVQGKVTTGSTGLGLYFCRRAAELIGGRIAHGPREDGGAVFSLELPSAAETGP